MFACKKNIPSTKSSYLGKELPHFILFIFQLWGIISYTL